MSGRKDSARAALGRVPYLHPAMHEPILAELKAENLLDNPARSNGGAVHASATSFSDTRRAAVLTMMQAAAADQRNVEMLRIFRANARRLGVGALFADDSKAIDVDALNTALRDKPLEDRMRFKEMCYSLRLIPA